MRTIEQALEVRERRRLAAEDRFLARQEQLERAAQPLIGELCREGKTVYYINLLDRKGRFTGKIRESHSEQELVSYLIRNRYVRAH